MVFGRLIPREEKFVDFFVQVAGLTVDGARELEILLNNQISSDESFIQELETKTISGNLISFAGFESGIYIYSLTGSKGMKMNGKFFKWFDP